MSQQSHSKIIDLVNKRWKILELLSRGPHASKDIADKLGKSKPWTSTQLALLYTSGIVTFEQKGDKRYKYNALTRTGRQLYTGLSKTMEDLKEKGTLDPKEVDLLLRYLRSVTENNQGKKIPISEKGLKKIAKDMQSLTVNYILPTHEKLMQFLADNFDDPQYAAVHEELVNSIYNIINDSGDNRTLLAENEAFIAKLEQGIDDDKNASVLIDIFSRLLPGSRGSQALLTLYQQTFGKNKDITGKLRGVLIERDLKNRIRVKEFLYQVLTSNDALFDLADREIQALGTNREGIVRSGHFVVTG